MIEEKEEIIQKEEEVKEEVKEVENNTIKLSDEDLNELKKGLELADEYNATLAKLENQEEFIKEAVEKINLEGTGFDKEDVIKLFSGDGKGYNEVLIKGMNNEMGMFLNKHKELLTLLFTPKTDNHDELEYGVRIVYDNLEYVIKDEYIRNEITVKKTSNENDLGYVAKSFKVASDIPIINSITETNADLFKDVDTSSLSLEVVTAFHAYEEYTRKMFLEKYLIDSDYSLVEDILNFDRFKEIYDNGSKDPKEVNLGYHFGKLEKKIFKLFDVEGSKRSNQLSSQTKIIRSLVSELLENNIVKIGTMCKLFTERLNENTSVNIFTIEIWLSLLIDYLNISKIEEDKISEEDKKHIEYLNSLNIGNNKIMEFYNNVNML